MPQRHFLAQQIQLSPISYVCISDNRYGVQIAYLQFLGAAGLVLLLVTGELIPSNVVGFCIAASNAFGLIAGITFAS